MGHSLASGNQNSCIRIKPAPELKDKTSIATIAVRDLALSRKFYEEKLGLPLLETDTGHYAAYKTGTSRLLVYQSTFVENQGVTVATFEVGDDIEKIIAILKGNGVPFEHYSDIPGGENGGDIYTIGTMKKAWLKDPDGNIICLTNSMCSLYFI